MPKMPLDRTLSPLRRKVTVPVEEEPNPRVVPQPQPQRAAPEVSLGSGTAERARKALKQRRKSIADAIKEAGG